VSPLSWSGIARLGRGFLAVTCVFAFFCVLPAAAQKAPARIDGLYEFQAKPHTGTLAVKSIKGGVIFDLTTVSPKGATCTASGKATGGSILTFREEAGGEPDAGFRLTILRDQITISGLLGRVSETSFCGLNALLTGVYKRRGPLDAEAAAVLAAIETPPKSKPAPPLPAVTPAQPQPSLQPLAQPVAKPR
jgi:hypothetical protein